MDEDMSRLKGLSAVEFAEEVLDELEPEDDLELDFLATATGAASLLDTAAVNAALSAGVTTTGLPLDGVDSSFSSPSDAPTPPPEHPAHASTPTSAAAKTHIRLTRSPFVARTPLGTM